MMVIPMKFSEDEKEMARKAISLLLEASGLLTDMRMSVDDRATCVAWDEVRHSQLKLTEEQLKQVQIKVCDAWDDLSQAKQYGFIYRWYEDDEETDDDTYDPADHAGDPVAADLEALAASSLRH